MQRLNKGYPDYPYKNAPIPPRFDLSKYIAAVRERLGIFIAIAVLTSGGILFAISQMEPLYKARTTIHLLRQSERQLQFEEVTEETLSNSEDLNTQVNLFQSHNILERVAKRIDEEIGMQFRRPYEQVNESQGHSSILPIVAQNRNIIPSRLSLVVIIEYTHPDPEVAAQVANFYHEEITATYSDLRAGTMTQAIRDLRAQAEIQRRKVENLDRELVEYKNLHNTISLDQGLDIDRAEMGMLNSSMTVSKERLDTIQTRWNIVQRKINAGESLRDVPFFAEDPSIRNLTATLSSLRIQIAELSQRYRHLHPKMIQATESLMAAQKELSTALEIQVEILNAQLEQAQTGYRTAAQKVESKKKDILQLQEMSSVYDSKIRDLEINEKLYQTFFNRIQEIEAQNSGQVSRIRIVDPAATPLHPFQPDIKVGILLAAGAGVICGAIVVVILIFFDDRIKSSIDIEDRVNLPIIGMLGLLKGRNRSVQELATIASRDPQTTETLNSIVAGLRLDPASKDAGVILITSTISNEGKSYVSASLASAFQRYDEKTLLINCDLRARENRLELMAGQGLVPFLERDDRSLKQSIYHSQHLHCDVMPAGGLHKQPFNLYSSSKFKAMINELRSQYDRIIIDTPPTHLFGDTLSLLDHCDGQIFVAGFGRARIRIASKTVDKLIATNCPVFGAVINGIKVHQAKMYYPDHYHDVASYSSYGEKRAAKY